MKQKALIVYGIGVYFPDRELLTFEILAHEFEICKEVVYFYKIDELGMRDFVASLTHVAYIIVKDKPTSMPLNVELPKDFGKIV
jgi:hypothetical protein